MGADGGSVPRRDEVVKTKKITTTATNANTTETTEAMECVRWQQCALSHVPLCEPIVTDALGTLFNKDAIIRGLLSHSLPNDLSHIKSLRDLFPINLTRNPAAAHQQKEEEEEEEEKEASSSSLKWPFICPVSRKEAGAGGQRGRMVSLQPCGCCVAESVLSELKSHSSSSLVLCVACGAKLSQDLPYIVVNGTKADIANARSRIATATAKKHGSKRHETEQHSQSDSEKKKKKKKTKTTKVSTQQQPPAKRPKKTTETGGSSSVAAAGAGATAMPKGASEDVYRSLFHPQISMSERSEDLFLHRAGAGGIL